MPDRILVTGADGFIGRHLVAALESEGFEVIRHTHRDGDLARCSLPYEGVSHICHLASRTFVPDSWRSPRDFYDTNFMGTLNVLEFCRREHAFLILMSSYVYGQPKFLPIDESHPVQALNPYAHSKLLAEEAAQFYAAQFLVELAIIRPFNLYGPGQNADFLIPMLIRQALAPGGTITVADERPKRDFLHVEDLVRLILALLRSRATGIFNAGSGASVSIRQLVDLINLVTPRPKQLISTARIRENEILDTVADCAKATMQLGWKPEIPLADGIHGLVKDALTSTSAAVFE